MERVSKHQSTFAVVVAAFFCALVLMLVPSSALAADDDIASGTSGTCTWVIDADGVLTISPTDGVEGYLDQYFPDNSYTSTPWYDYRRAVTSIVIEEGAYANTNAAWLFYDMRNATSFGGDGASTFATSKTTCIRSMFDQCRSLTSLDLSGWDTSNVNDMDEVFESCASLVSINVSSWDVSNVVDMHSMFAYCTSLVSLDISDWNTSSVDETLYMFKDCSSLVSLDLSGWDTSSLVQLRHMFEGCSSLESLDLSGWNIPTNVENMTDIFADCSSLSKISLGTGWIWKSASAATLSTPDTELGMWISYDAVSEDVRGVAYTAEDLATNWDGESYAGTWVWQLTYTVTFTDGLDGTVFEDQSYSVDGGDSVPEFEGTLERDGYTFSGWSTDGETVIDVSDAMVSEDVTYIAVWSCAHDEYTSVVIEPTCTEGGYTTYTCSACGETWIADETEALGHSYSSKVTVAATCTKDGVLTYTCATCGDTYTKTIAATGHVYESAVTEPTCTEGGYTTYVCATCGDTYIDNETSANGHTEADAVIENNVEATATSNGSYDTVVYCSVCGEELSRETVNVPATGVAILRLYNPWSGEHLYTIDTNELTVLTGLGWNDEGIAWYAPTSGSPLFIDYTTHIPVSIFIRLIQMRLRNW